MGHLDFCLLLVEVFGTLEIVFLFLKKSILASIAPAEVCKAQSALEPDQRH